MHMYGCRVIQNVLEHAPLPEKLALVEELHNNVLNCTQGQHSNHVIQKCIERVPSEHLLFVAEEIGENAFKLSFHQYGCRVIQKIIEFFAVPERAASGFDIICTNGLTAVEQKALMFREILQNICELANDQYGNYVIQHLITNGKPDIREIVLQEIKPNMFTLSRGKFSSNVIEKCLVNSSSEQLKYILELLTHKNSDK